MCRAVCQRLLSFLFRFYCAHVCGGVVMFHKIMCSRNLGVLSHLNAVVLEDN